MIGSVAQFGNSSRRTVAAGQVSPDDDYRRQARRLRRIYAKNPSLMHQRLRQLAESRGGAGERHEQPVAKSPSLAANSPAAWYFAERVAGRLQVGLLAYSDRVALLKEAQGLGIKRFEANLIIAVTQHRMGGVRATVAQQAAELRGERQRRWFGWAGVTGVVLGVQAAIVGLAWWVMRG